MCACVAKCGVSCAFVVTYRRAARLWGGECEPFPLSPCKKLLILAEASPVFLDDPAGLADKPSGGGRWVGGGGMLWRRLGDISLGGDAPSPVSSPLAVICSSSGWGYLGLSFLRRCDNLPQAVVLTPGQPHTRTSKLGGAGLLLRLGPGAPVGSCCPHLSLMSKWLLGAHSHSILQPSHLRVCMSGTASRLAGRVSDFSSKCSQEVHLKMALLKTRQQILSTMPPAPRHRPLFLPPPSRPSFLSS